MLNHPGPLYSLERLPGYIGREVHKTLLRTYTARVAEEERCYVLYFEAQGGLGKTRLLQLYPQVLEDQHTSLPPVSRDVRVCQIVDFYSFQNRDPVVIERQLIDGLKQSEAAEWYRLPAEQVDSIFGLYFMRLIDYQQAQESRKEARISEALAALRVAFVQCWNRLAAEHPLVMCFDTLETLFFRPAPPEALVNTGSEMAGIDLVLDWMRDVLPNLTCTLVLLSGRPVEHNRLAEELSASGLLVEPVQQLKPFETLHEIRAYLEAYHCPTSSSELAYIQQITEGRPLLLTCFAETRRSSSAMPPGLPHMPSPQVCASRPEFEDWLVGTFLNPMVDGLPLPTIHNRHVTLSYCLYFLVYARRGIPRDELVQLFEDLELPYDQQTIEQLDQVALVKRIGDLLFLHDEIFLMIDTSGKPDEFGLREPALDHLCIVSTKMVQQASQTHLLGAMADNMYYEMTRDFEQGYRIYGVYIDRLLVERRINAALVLSDAFWRTLNYRVIIDKQPVYPYRNALLQSMLTEEKILRDEQVRRVELLRTRDQAREAFELAHRLFDQFVQQKIIPEARDILEQDLHGKDLYLFATLSIKRAIATAQTQALDYERHAEHLFQSVIDLLEQREVHADEMLHMRRWYLLGQAYISRGYLRRLQNRFAEAQRDAEAGLSAYKQYRKSSEDRPSAEELLHDRVVTEVAQAMNNLAYTLARSGNMKRALRLSNELVNERGDYIHAMSDYQKALFYNTNGLIYIRSARYLEAERPIQLAEQAAREARRQRARGLVNWARAQLETARMRARREINLDIEHYYQEAAEFLYDEPDQLRELFYSWSAFLRDVANLHSQSGAEDGPAQARMYQDRALGLLDRAIELLPTVPSLQRAEFVDSKVTIYNIRGDYEQAENHIRETEAIMSSDSFPEYAQVICGRVAMQQADIALHRDQDYRKALLLMTTALARAYVFAEQHRDQDTFERLIDRFIEDIPSEELEAYSRDIEDTSIQVSPEALPYQPPDDTAWMAAWRKSLRAIQESVTTRLDI
jgi:tetratricopeptide (TPR) repeat protein